MTLTPEQMENQTSYELSLSLINGLFSDCLLTREEYRKALSGIEGKYRPIVRHISLLIKE